MNIIYIDSTGSTTDLCEIGAKHNTDKSPYSQNCSLFGHRKGYTSFYETIFATMRYKEIDMCEIGIEVGASLLTFSEYFPNANICAMEFHEDKIENCRRMNIPRTEYFNTDVTDRASLEESFKKAGRLFDIILEDTTHIKEDQINTIEVAAKYLKPGGILIIEDNYRTDSNDKFDTADLTPFSHCSFVVCDHQNKNTFDNDVIWFAIKK